MQTAILLRPPQSAIRCIQPKMADCRVLSGSTTAAHWRHKHIYNNSLRHLSGLSGEIFAQVLTKFRLTDILSQLLEAIGFPSLPDGCIDSITIGCGSKGMGKRRLRCQTKASHSRVIR